MCNEIWYLVGCLPYIFAMWHKHECYETACAGYLGHPFLENNGFCERMSQVASIALLSSHLYFIHTITDTYQESTIGVSSRVPAAWLLC